MLSLGYHLLVAVSKLHVHLAELGMVSMTLVYWYDELVYFIDGFVDLIFKKETGSIFKKVDQTLF